MMMETRTDIFFRLKNGFFLHFNRREIHQVEQLLTDFVSIFFGMFKRL